MANILVYVITRAITLENTLNGKNKKEQDSSYEKHTYKAAS